MPDTSYIICATPRSGSSLLVEALRSTDLAGRPREFFNPKRLREENWKWRFIADDAFLSKMFEEGTTPNGVFGVKIMWGYYKSVVRKLRAMPEYRRFRPPELFDKVFPGLRYIHMTRKDKVHQAVSLAKATQSDIWSDFDPASIEQREKSFNYKPDIKMMERNARYKKKRKELSARMLKYDFGKINRHYKMLLADDVAWEDYFKGAGISPFRVVYEDFVRSYEETALDIHKYLDIELPPLPDKITFARRALKKQGDEVNDEWAERFQQDLSKPPSRLGSVLGRVLGRIR